MADQRTLSQLAIAGAKLGAIIGFFLTLAVPAVSFVTDLSSFVFEGERIAFESFYNIIGVLILLLPSLIIITIFGAALGL